MAACNVCGNKAGLLKEICTSCELEIQAKKEAEIQAKREAEQQAWEEEVQQRLDDWVERTNARLKNGESVFLYQTVYVSIDSTTESDGTLADFNVLGLQARGLTGWNVLSIIPRTYGSVLHNEQTTQWGTTTLYAGGMGGNVIGAYAVLSKEIKKLDNSPLGVYAIDTARELIEEGYEI